MSTHRMTLVVGVALVLASLAGWRIFHHMQSDAALRAGDAEAALRWQPGNPAALYRDAAEKLAAGDIDSASQQARALLRTNPIDGRGYRLLAQVAEQRGNGQQALALYQVAVRRAPRDPQARAWLAQHHLDAGEFDAALAQVDQVLRQAPGARTQLLPALASMATQPSFADALAKHLGSRPEWRGHMLRALQAKGADPTAATQVLSALREQGGLLPDEAEAWVEGLIQQGRWGEAQARWAQPFLAAGKPVPLLFNGDFASAPSGLGFDWRLPRRAFVVVDFETGVANGQALHARFLGGRARGSIATHALLLAPGRYRLQWRERGEGVSTDPGVAWTLTCIDKTRPLVVGPATRNRASWAEVALEFEVPTDCQGQWLGLGATGGAQAGELWMADVRLAREGLATK